MRVLQLRILSILAVTGLLVSAEDAKAWGRFGHLAVCDLAYRNFTDTTRDELKKLFQTQQGGITVKGKGKMPDRSTHLSILAALKKILYLESTLKIISSTFPETPNRLQLVVPQMLNASCPEFSETS